MNEEEGEWFGRHDHPLLNHVILENLFQYVRLVDLMQCRAVSKKWNVLTIAFIRSKFTLGIHLSKEWLQKNRNRDDDEPNCGTIENFVQVFSKNKHGIPIAKFWLGPFCTTEGVGQRFLTLVGDTTTELRLCQEGGNEVFRVEDVSAILRSMKKLEILEMSEKLVTDLGNVVELFPDPKPKLSSLKRFTFHSGVDEGEPISCCPTFINELITAAENISDLAITDRFREPAHFDFFDEIVNSNISAALSAIETLGRESSIQTLSLEGIRMNLHVEILHRMAAKRNGLKLRGLSFSMDDDDDEEENHFELVELFKDTLEDLCYSGTSCFSFLDFPKIPKLRRLTWTISNDFTSELVNLTKISPILKELELYLHETLSRHQVDDDFLAQAEPCPAMNSLSLINGPHLRINPFNHLLTMFPRLTKLRIEIEVDGAEILRQIWTRMTELESLNISGLIQTEESVDSLITGISTEAIQGITGVLNDLDETTVEVRRDTIQNLRNRHCQLPSIGNLTKLRRLDIDVVGEIGDGNGNQSSYLSDVSGFLGFYSMKHLSDLIVQKCELTETCCEMLIREVEVRLESWEFTTPDGRAII